MAKFVMRSDGKHQKKVYAVDSATISCRGFDLDDNLDVPLQKVAILFWKIQEKEPIVWFAMDNRPDDLDKMEQKLVEMFQAKEIEYQDGSGVYHMIQG